MPDKSEKHVRFYFGVSISCLIPPSPHGKRDGVSDADWEEKCLNGILSDLKAKLSKGGFEVAYRKHVPLDRARRLYAADFVVSALHKFLASQVFTLRKGHSGFRVRKKAFLKATAIMKKKIAGLLKWDYVLNAIAHEYAASRTFVFDLHLEAVLKLRRVLSRREIKDAGGSVSEAIENFNDEVVESLDSLGALIPKSTRRRPKDNVYEYDVALTRSVGFSENAVHGDGLVLMTKGMPHDDAILLGIDFDLDIDDFISSERDGLEHSLEEGGEFSLPEKAVVKQISVHFIDWDEDFVEYCDELL